ncbi:hypothetical protein P7H20_02375 [Paenibacillus larvae]|nr:YebC/PmpR family DNA-binding transcriptional regulator [Paenibacillus larvae]MDT2273964.1 hypothetical protein [Paenibacillus larvae]MDT2294140.1 hypothetical protein [Paenibacillus larvae]
MVKTLTDNRNRSAADIRAIFNKRGGNMGKPAVFLTCLMKREYW